MKTIQLTQNKIAIVDEEDYERLNQFKWYASWDGKNWYAEKKRRETDGKQKTILMHREIMDAPKGIQIDHRNGDGLFNCKENLRFATHQQNQFNQRKARNNNKLGIKGVYWHKQHKKFHARIKINGKQIHLGYFNVLGDADSAYRIAEEKYFGEFARQL